MLDLSFIDSFINSFFRKTEKETNYISIIDSFPGYYILVFFINGKISKISFLEEKSVNSGSNAIYRCYPKTLDNRLSGLFFKYNNGSEFGFINFKKLPKYAECLRTDISSLKSFLALEYKKFYSNKSNVFTGILSYRGFRMIFVPNENVNDKTVKVIGNSNYIKKNSKKEFWKNIKYGGIIKINNVAEKYLTENQLKSELEILVSKHSDVINSTSDGLLYCENNFLQFIFNQCYNYNHNIVISCSANIHQIFKQDLNKFNIKYKIEEHKLNESQYYSFYKLIEDISNSKVKTKDGIVINFEKTNAMWSVDINSGSFGDNSLNIYENIKQVNENALKKIFEYIDLIGIEGLITIDLIDMYKIEDKEYIQTIIDDYCKKNSYKCSKINLFNLVSISKTREGRCLYTQIYKNEKNTNIFGAMKMFFYIKSQIFSSKNIQICLNEDTLLTLIKSIDKNLNFAVIDINTSKTLKDFISKNVKIIFYIDNNLKIPVFY